MDKVRKAVIVEDNPQMRSLICTALQSLGVKDIASAENGLDALDRLQEMQADVAIVDWEMDVMDGIEFTRRVREGHGAIRRDTPILMLTAVIGEENARRAYDTGVDLFMNKPFSMKSLFHGIQTLLQAK